jgi:Tfp pilus assembly protein PilN
LDNAIKNLLDGIVGTGNLEEFMAERINFLEKGAYVITYKKMVMLIAAWVAICFSIFIFESIFRWVVHSRLNMLVKHHSELSSEQQKAMALLEATKESFVKPEMKKLSEIYDNYPAWSRVLYEVAKRRPSLVSLTEITTAFGTEGGGTRKMELSGRGQGADMIANFVSTLNNSSLFRNVMLNKSAKASGEREYGYTFVMVGEILFGAKKWD